MELKIYIPTEVIEYFIRRRFDEQKKGCLCHECTLTKALCLAVLKHDEENGPKLKKPPTEWLQ
jgi:hypothetical protein